nr:AraC family transcriptional regulator [uncultured Devosia sp.]
MQQVYFPLDCTATDPTSFEGSLSALQLDKIGISKFVANASRTVRRHQTSGTEEVVFIFPTRERESFGQLGMEDDVGPGEMYILNAAEDYWTQIGDETHNVTIKVPASIIRERLPFLDTTYGRKDVANAGLVPIVAQLALQTFHMLPAANAVLLQRAEENILELMCLMLETHDVRDMPESTAVAVSDVTFQRISAFLSYHFGDPDLAPEHAANALRVSVRYVHKVFQQHGTTFGRELLALRLREADRLLRAPSMRNLSVVPISEIAYSCGFSSQSHFSVRYKEHFGFTPSERRHSGPQDAKLTTHG